MNNTRVGVTGWLTPDGNFLPCEYGNHHILANKLLKQSEGLEKRRIALGIQHGTVYQGYETLKLDNYVPMGSKGPGFEDLSNIHFPRTGYTSAQKEWLREHWNELDEYQQDFLQKYGELDTHEDHE